MFHEPVLVNEAIHFLRPESGIFVDCTLGGGGHARAILEALAAHGNADAGSDRRPGRGTEPAGAPFERQAGNACGPGRFRSGLVGIDCDAEALASAKRQLTGFDNMELVHANYTDLAALVRGAGLCPVQGVLFDFGVSLHQLVTPERGFGAGVDGPLDMRFDQTSGRPSCLEVLRRVSQKELRGWLRTFGEEPMSGRVARVICEHRREIRTTGDLARVVRSAVPGRLAAKALSRVFQALRIITNDELENVRRGLKAALEVLAPGGRLVAISFHSLEDREVKRFIRAEERLTSLTRKPVRPGLAEVARNPRSRSARLRAAEVPV
jgi:16S rRNA (cytosine1402-N4)-methyltransferase